jgi:hypothetical protein
MEQKRRRSKDGRLGVSISAAAADKLLAIQKRLEAELGFEPSASQMVEYLVTDYILERQVEQQSTCPTRKEQ